MDKNDTLNIKKSDAALSYLALGDSYTIGEAVAQNESFPFQLAAGLNNMAGSTPILTEKPILTQKPVIIAKTGWTTGELQEAINAASLTATYDLVTLLIGVNNQYRGSAITTYRTEFRELLQQAIAFAKGDLTHVFVVSIPDWGATPFGRESGRGQDHIAAEIDAFNAVNKEETLKAGVVYIDITPGSRKANTDVTLVASDSLHPSGRMYKEWTADILPAVVKVFKK